MADVTSQDHEQARAIAGSCERERRGVSPCRERYGEAARPSWCRRCKQADAFATTLAEQREQIYVVADEAVRALQANALRDQDAEGAVIDIAAAKGGEVVAAAIRKGT